MFAETSDDTGTVFRDTITLALLGFVVLVLALLPHVNPKGRDAEHIAPPPGNIMVELRWPDDMDVDVDLWVQAPGDVPVGYSNKGGAVFNLLRDDLGRRTDPLGLNYENSYSRGIIPGEYTVNVHLYRGAAPVPATVVVSIKKDRAPGALPKLTTETVLTAQGEERTVFRFTLDANGNIQPGSVHGLFKPLRTWRNS